MHKTFSHIRAWISGALLLAACVAGTGVAEAQAVRSLKDAMFGHNSVDGRTQTPPKVAHFVSEDGESFVFDKSGPMALMRFDGEDEVWTLTPSQGARGDVVYKNDVGEPVLKATRWGGLILFSDDRPMGDPVAVTGKAEAFTPARISPALLFQTFAKASRRVSLLLQRNLGFEALDDITPDSAALYANAASVTSEAIVQVAGQSQGRRVLEQVRVVHFMDGRPHSASLDKGVLTLKLDVSRGTWGGRPSSKRISNLILTSYSLADNDHR